LRVDESQLHRLINAHFYDRFLTAISTGRFLGFGFLPLCAAEQRSCSGDVGED